MDTSVHFTYFHNYKNYQKRCTNCKLYFARRNQRNLYFWKKTFFSKIFFLTGSFFKSEISRKKIPKIWLADLFSLFRVVNFSGSPTLQGSYSRWQRRSFSLTRRESGTKLRNCSEYYHTHASHVIGQKIYKFRSLLWLAPWPGSISSYKFDSSCVRKFCLRVNKSRFYGG